MKLNKKEKVWREVPPTPQVKREEVLPLLLRRTASLLLWENNFYEDGETTVREIISLSHHANAYELEVALRFSKDFCKLRHTPILLLALLVEKRGEWRGLSERIWKILFPRTLTRADDMGEYLSIRAKVKGESTSKMKKWLSSCEKKGLARAFGRFNSYHLAKYNRDSAEVKLRDILLLTHPKPKDLSQSEAFKQLLSNTLPPPLTWEVELSSGKDKREAWERLLKEEALGDLAFLRNLRNMHSVGVERDLIISSFAKREFGRILPFQFISAFRHAPTFTPQLEDAMLRALSKMEKLEGETLLFIDTSGSMQGMLSGRGEISRRDAAVALTILLREVCERVRIIPFNTEGKELHNPPRGFALDRAVPPPQGGTLIGKVLLSHPHHLATARRVVVLTDEESQDAIPDISHIVEHPWMFNIAPYGQKQALEKGGWHYIHGFSERLLDFIPLSEEEEKWGEKTKEWYEEKEEKGKG